MLAGDVHCYANDEETRTYLNDLKRSHDKDNWNIVDVDVDEEAEIESIDDDILNLEKDKLSMEDQKNRLELLKIYQYGDYFGSILVLKNQT